MLRKYKNEPGKVSATVSGTLTRNAAGRLRIGQVAVDIRMQAEAAAVQHLDRILQQFEDFCVVTESVRSGFSGGGDGARWRGQTAEIIFSAWRCRARAQG